MKKQAILLLLICLVSSPRLFAQDFKVRASVNRNPVRLDQQFEVNIELSGSNANSVPNPEIPAIDDFASYLGSGSSTSMQIVNGRMSVSKVLTYHFIATKEGTFRIPPVKLNYGGKVYASEAIELEIIKGSAGSPPRSSNNPRSPNSDTEDLSEQLFLQASVHKNQVYQNEPVVVSYKIYTSVNVSNYGISQLPKTVGFWSEEFDLPQRPRLYNEVVDGREYRVAEIKKMALFPQGPGTKTLDPMIIECEVQLPRRQRRSRDIFDSFFEDSFFGRTVRRTVRSSAMSIDVLPLPKTNKPGDFSGAVGNFSIAASVDKNEVKTNEAVTFKVTVSGTGNIKIIPQPNIQFSSDFEVYDPKVTERINRSSNKISGSKTFEYVMIPRFAGMHTVKPVTFSFFDPAFKSYKTISTAPIDIAVAKGDDPFVSAGGINSQAEVKFIGQDIRFIQMRLPEFKRIDSVFYKNSLFYVVLILPLLGLFAGFGYRKHLDKLSSNVAYARSRKANQMALKRLKQANKEMQAGKAREFFSEISKALMGFIGDKLNVSSAGLITEQVKEMLHERGIDDAIATEYLNCLQMCDFQRFAPSDSNNHQMKEFFDQAKKAIINLDKPL